MVAFQNFMISVIFVIVPQSSVIFSVYLYDFLCVYPQVGKICPHGSLPIHWVVFDIVCQLWSWRAETTVF